MARIDDYNTDSTITGLDKVIGTDENDGSTKNYTMNGIKSFVLSGGASGTFTSNDGKTITVVDGVITSIV